MGDCVGLCNAEDKILGLFFPFPKSHCEMSRDPEAGLSKQSRRQRGGSMVQMFRYLPAPQTCNPWENLLHADLQTYF